jgi:hypothetical protein
MRAAGARGVATEGGVQLYLRPTRRSEGHYATLPVCAPTDDSNEWTCPDYMYMYGRSIFHTVWS